MIHSATKLKTQEIFYGLKDGHERPMDIDLKLKERNKFSDEVILANERTQNNNLACHNKGREKQFHIDKKYKDKKVYKLIQGIKRKTKERYESTKAVEDLGRQPATRHTSKQVANKMGTVTSLSRT